MNFKLSDTEHARCCSCERLWKDCETVYPHIVPLHIEATWERPVLGNLLVGNRATGQAIALICNQCHKYKRPILFAVEFQPEIPGLPGKNIVYHKIETL